MYSSGDLIATSIIVAAIALLIGGFTGASIRGDVFEKEAITKGFAEYNQTNGVWQWKSLDVR